MQHVFRFRVDGVVVLHMEIEAGETYYVIGSISMGFLVGRPNIAPSDQASFDKIADKLKLSN